MEVRNTKGFKPKEGSFLTKSAEYEKNLHTPFYENIMKEGIAF
jgi:hypothetical protein